MGGFQNIKRMNENECECLSVCANALHRALSLRVFDECVERERVNCVSTVCICCFVFKDLKM